MKSYKSHKFEEAIEAMKKFDEHLSNDERELIRQYNHLQREISKAIDEEMR